MNQNARQEIQWPISPMMAGGIVGLVVLTLLLPGGYDGGLYYLRLWWPQTTAPIWVHAVLAPVVWLPWPLPWTSLVFLTAVLIILASRIWQTPWWIALFSIPALWTIWLGQIEGLILAGAALAWLVIQGRVHPVWLGLAGIALMTKFQVGTLLALAAVWWLWQDRGWRSLISPALLASVVVGLTLLIQPDWPWLWAQSLQRLSPAGRFFDSSILPWGLLALPVALWPTPIPRRRRARMLLAATLLASPYFANYHCVTLLTTEDRPLVYGMTWFTVVPMLVANDQTWAWIIPLAILLLDARRTYLERNQPHQP